MHEFNVHAEIAALTGSRIKTRLGASDTPSTGRRAKRIVLDVRRKQIREFGL